MRGHRRGGPEQLTYEIAPRPVPGRGEVYGLIPFTRDGAAAQFVAVPPARLDHDHAAALPLAGLTAWQGLVVHGGLRPGARVLVQGGVGSFAVQVAVALGASVTATADAEAVDFVREPGAEQVVDHRSERFEEQVEDVDWSSTPSAATPRSAPGRWCVPAAAW